MSTTETTALEEVTHRAEEEPLSQRQSLFWLDEQLFPDARYNNLVLTIELHGPLDPDRFSRAWADTVRASDAMQVELDPSLAVQRFTCAEPPPLPLVAVEPDKVERWIAEQSVRPLLGRGPAWTAMLVRAGPTHHVFVLVIFHAITDGISASLLVEELAERYAGRMPDPGVPFRDYLRAEAAYRASPQSDRDQAYWSRVLEGGVPPLRLYGIARKERSTAVERSWLDPPGLGARLAALAGREPFSTITVDLSQALVLATGFAGYLHRVTGNRQLLLGLPIANRAGRHASTRGLLMQPLFLKIEVEPSDTFATLARRTRHEAHAALVHGRFSNSNRGVEYATLNLLPALPQRFADLDARIRFAPATALPESHVGQGDLRDTVALWAERDGATGLRLALELHRGTFDEGLRRRARQHLVRVFESLAADPDQPLDAVDLLDAEEALSVRAAARGPQPEGDAPDVVEAVALQARRTPERIAVEGPDLTIRYDELERASNRAAHRLRRMGVVPGSRVGVAVPRGAGELISLLAVLKAGGAYVPLDDTHPVERIRIILEDAAPQVLIAPAGAPLAAAVPGGTKLLPLEELVPARGPGVRGGEAARTSGEDPLGEVCAPDQVAYVLFTSGSTGRPKGVEVPRGAFANFLRAMRRAPGISSGERLLAVTTTTFDIAGLELFLPLTVGGTVVIADRDTATDPRRLRRALERGRVMLMQATPATWRLLIEAGWAGDRRLKVLCGGEALTSELAAQLLDRCGELWNMYGPTETTVWSTLDRVTHGGPITIGRPIDWTDVHVLGPGLRPLPVGVVGEIYIGGRGVARGYCGRADLTAERFVPNPLGPGRLYRTGDLGRLLEDGRFECLGRVDHQVKVRGFRIELGEIESVLRGVEGTQDAVVVAEASGNGDSRLIAYWIGTAERSALLEAARKKLPPYMIPAAYVRMEAFPLTTSGKVDRRALPRPDAGAAPAPVLRLPRNDLETRVAAVFADVLEIPAVGVDQDFFTMGGTSMLAVEARARLEAELGIEIPLRVLFETPTVEGIVERLGSPAPPDEPIVVPLRRGAEGIPPLFCFLGVQLYLDLALALDPDIPVIGMHVVMPYRVHVDRRPSVEEIARRYLRIVQERQPHGPYHLAGLCFGGVVAYEAARQLEAVGEEVALVTIFDGPLPRAFTVDRSKRIMAGTKSLLGRPAEIIRWASRWMRRRLPSTPAVNGRYIDVPIDGPEVIAELQRYERSIGSVRTHLVVFRSMLRKPGVGITVAPDLGWCGAADRVTLHDVAAEHIEIVRQPHASQLAAVLGPLLRERRIAPAADHRPQVEAGS